MEDGLELLARVFSTRQAASLIERTARWVAPETFHYLPVWYPEFGRGDLLYKKNWSEPQYNTSRKTGQTVHKHEGNVKANKALSSALGVSGRERPNWSCCHIWGVDDPSYQKSNTVVSDKRYFSCVGNMVLLPSALKAFTDSMPEIKTMLRVSAAALYRWSCEHPDIVDLDGELSSCDWSCYPESWPRHNTARRPLGVVAFDAQIKARADKRLREIADDLRTAGSHYPREAVLETLEYWGIDLDPATG